MGSMGQIGQKCRVRQTSRVVIVAGALVGQLLVLPQNAGAALAQCESQPNEYTTHHVGQIRADGGAVAYGVKASITAERGALCSSDVTNCPPPATNPPLCHNFNSVYVMLAPGPLPNPDPESPVRGWAQVGHHRYANETTYHFAQNWDGNSPYENYLETSWYITPVNRDTPYEYVARYSDGCSCIRMFIDGALVQNSDFNPFVSWEGNGPWSYQITAESRYLASDVPGSPSNRTEIYNMHLWSSVNTYYPMPCGSLKSHNDNPSRWATTRLSCISAQIWTQ